MGEAGDRRVGRPGLQGEPDQGDARPGGPVPRAGGAEFELAKVRGGGEIAPR